MIAHDDEIELWAHRDQGFVAFAIAGGLHPKRIADLDTPRPLFVFDEPARSPFIENICTNYKMHLLDAYKRMTPHRVLARSMACADQQLDLLIAFAREAGLAEIEIPEDTVWIWLSTDDDEPCTSAAEHP